MRRSALWRYLFSSGRSRAKEKPLGDNPRLFGSGLVRDQRFEFVAFFSFCSKSHDKCTGVFLSPIFFSELEKGKKSSVLQKNNTCESGSLGRDLLSEPAMPTRWME
jgi:hypothetical protein